MARFVAALLALGMWLVCSAAAANWSEQGGDAGNTKYSADDIPSQVVQSYVKRFHGHYSGEGNTYMYASSVVIHNGQAFIMTNDQPYASGSDMLPLQTTLLDWSTGTTLKNIAQPGFAEWGAHSFHPGENAGEEDQRHFTNTVVWNDYDGQIYARRGGDQCTCGALDVNSGLWRQFGIAGWDASPFMQVYGDRVIYRPGDISGQQAFQEYKVGPADWTPGGQPTLAYEMGPSAHEIIVAAQASYFSGLYGDIPKVAQSLCVQAGSVYNLTSRTYTTYIQVTPLNTNQPLWYKGFADDWGGLNRNQTHDNYWRFVATETGDYAFFTRAPGQPVTVRVLDLQTGNQKWSMPLAGANERPLLAAHGNNLFVVGANEQYEVDINTGAVAWTTHTPILEAGYTISVDQEFEPMVLTDDTLWVVSGQTGSTKCDLLGISTLTGAVIQDIDLAARYAGTGEFIVAVNDLVAANGKIGVLLGIDSRTDPHVGLTNLEYQDLLVFDAVPEPATVPLLLAGFIAVVRRSRKK